VCSTQISCPTFALPPKCRSAPPSRRMGAVSSGQDGDDQATRDGLMAEDWQVWGTAISERLATHSRIAESPSDEGIEFECRHLHLAREPLELECPYGPGAKVLRRKCQGRGTGDDISAGS